MEEGQYVKTTTLWWFAVEGHDTEEILGYRLYMTDAETPMERTADGSVPGAQIFDLGKPKPDIEGKCYQNLGLLPNMTTNDGVYNLGTCTVDKAGNESSFSVIANVPLDFIVPDAPSGSGILRS